MRNGRQFWLLRLEFAIPESRSTLTPYSKKGGWTFAARSPMPGRATGTGRSSVIGWSAISASTTMGQSLVSRMSGRSRSFVDTASAGHWCTKSQKTLCSQGALRHWLWRQMKIIMPPGFMNPWDSNRGSDTPLPADILRTDKLRRVEDDRVR